MHPDRIGPYLIDRKIGSGGMGNVYYGVHEDTGQVAAVKVLPASLAKEEGFVQRFSREIQALKKLSSGHIVELFDDGSTQDGSWYYAMEYVDGETLTTLITRRQKLPWMEVSDISRQIAIALKAAHDAGVIHRDIKPSNLMVAPDGTVKLTDFGVAHVFATTRLTRTGGVVGTAEYMSPEQARGQRTTQRSDLYSLGAVMYAMLTGRPPFTGTNATEILHKQQFSQIEKPRHYAPETPRLFENLVCELLEKNPLHRTPNALVVSRKLDKIRSRVEFTERQQVEEIEKIAAASVGSSTEPAATTADEQIINRPGPATLVRDILRQEVNSQLDKSPLARVFDNTYVLAGMLLLVIGLGYYLIRNATPTAEENFGKAAAIMMQAEATPAWLRARDTLQEMLESKALPDRAEEMEQMIRQANQYEFCRSLERTMPIDGSRDSEIQRLVQRAFERFAQGNVDQARADLKAVATVLGHSGPDTEAPHLSAFIQSTLKQWESDTSISGRHLLLYEAQITARNPQAAQTAIELLDSILMLYQDDRMVVDEIVKCRDLLAEIRSRVVEE